MLREHTVELLAYLREASSCGRKATVEREMIQQHSLVIIFLWVREQERFALAGFCFCFDLGYGHLTQSVIDWCLIDRTCDIFIECSNGSISIFSKSACMVTFGNCSNAPVSPLRNVDTLMLHLLQGVVKEASIT